MSGRGSWRRVTGRVTGVLAVGLLAASMAAGCGSGSGSDSSAPSRDLAGPQANPADQKPAGDAGAGDAQGAVPNGQNAPARAPDKLPPDERSIIYTGTLTVRTDDVNAAADSAIAAARAANGIVGGDNRSVSDDQARAQVVLRVPADQFTAVIATLAKLGTEVHREVTTEDVTDQVVDVTSRVATAQASVDRVRALLARATTLGEIVSLESEVAKREAELESLKARLAKLSSLTAMSTITAEFINDGTKPLSGPDEEQSGFVAGLKGGWSSFTSSLEVLLTVLGALLPWFVAIGLPLLLVLLVLRRTAGRRMPALVGTRPEPSPAVADDD